MLQTSDEGRIGFVPSIKLVEGGGILCQRCFHMKHYGKLVPLSVPYERFSEFLEDLKDRDVLCVHVVDAMNFDSSVIPGLERLIGRKPLVLVVNKADLLPTDIRQHRIVKWVRRQAKRLGMQNIVAVHLVSAKKGLGMREAVRTIAVSEALSFLLPSSYNAHFPNSGLAEEARCVCHWRGECWKIHFPQSTPVHLVEFAATASKRLQPRRNNA